MIEDRLKTRESRKVNSTIGDGKRFCGGCGSTYPFTDEYWYVIPNGKHKGKARCRACISRLTKKYRNKEYVKGKTEDKYGHIKEGIVGEYQSGIPLTDIMKKYRVSFAIVKSLLGNDYLGDRRNQIKENEIRDFDESGRYKRFCKRCGVSWPFTSKFWYWHTNTGKGQNRVNSAGRTYTYCKCKQCHYRSRRELSKMNAEGIFTNRQLAKKCKHNIDELIRTYKSGVSLYKISRDNHIEYYRLRKLFEDNGIEIMRGRLITGENSANWKGGRTISHGYICLNAKHIEEPLKTWHSGERTVKEHRIVMERKLGRKLSREETVHHWNGIKTDNRIENLFLASRATHSLIHSELKRRLDEAEALLKSYTDGETSAGHQEEE